MVVLVSGSPRAGTCLAREEKWSLRIIGLEPRFGTPSLSVTAARATIVTNAVPKAPVVIPLISRTVLLIPMDFPVPLTSRNIP
jgi:hypothetical protein